MASDDSTGAITDDIRAFFASSLDGQVPGDSDDVFALGYVNSLFALQLVTYVESRFHLTITPEDLDLDNFRTIERIAAFVVGKQGAAVTSHGAAAESPVAGSA